MSNELLLNIDLGDDFFEKGPLVTDASLERKIFMGLLMYTVKVNPFSKDSAAKGFTIPGVFSDKVDGKTGLVNREGLKTFGYIPGITSKNHTLYVLVGRCVSSAGQEYQRVKVFKSWGDSEKTDQLDEKGKNIYKVYQTWAELQYPQLLNLSPDNRKRVTEKKEVFIEAEDLPTGRKWTDDNGQVKDNYYWDLSGKTYNTWEELRAAEKEHFTQTGNNGTASTLLDDLPQAWRDKNGDLTKSLQHQSTLLKQLAEGADVVAKAIEMSLIVNGKVAMKVDNSGLISIPNLFAAARGLPAQMFEENFAGFYK